MNRLKASDWLVVGGGAIVLVFGLFRWFKWRIVNESVVEFEDTSNAFDYLLTGVVPWLLIVGAAIVTVLLATDSLNPGNVPWPLVILTATVVGFVLILVRLIIGHDAETTGTLELEVSRGIGIWMSTLGALIAATGALTAFRDLGAGNGGDDGVQPDSGQPPPDREIPPPTP